MAANIFSPLAWPTPGPAAPKPLLQAEMSLRALTLKVCKDQVTLIGVTVPALSKPQAQRFCLQKPLSNPTFHPQTSVLLQVPACHKQPFSLHFQGRNPENLLGANPVPNPSSLPCPVSLSSTDPVCTAWSPAPFNCPGCGPSAVSSPPCPHAPSVYRLPLLAHRCESIL